ncbi:hypothetical protein [Streptomyces cacaoi]|uniref:Uncharacterized protein n=1 Tax=Streptomyces cacaoi TaxID=1898 RepID=A0A4Y3QY71_STRCI|nr:hypothetical protein [Streptomyces cacaoi]GEB50396.1 hypothetical protein SCA03_29470 [Streptomyces cacaoi]
MRDDEFMNLMRGNGIDIVAAELASLVDIYNSITKAAAEVREYALDQQFTVGAAEDIAHQFVVMITTLGSPRD